MIISDYFYNFAQTDANINNKLSITMKKLFTLLALALFCLSACEKNETSQEPVDTTTSVEVLSEIPMTIAYQGGKSLHTLHVYPSRINARLRVAFQIDEW